MEESAEVKAYKEISLVVREPGKKRSVVRLAPGNTIIGRGEDAGLRLEDKMVSQAHAMMILGEMGLQVVDLGSKNGLRINGRRMHTKELWNGDLIRLGKVLIRINAPGLIPEGEKRSVAGIGVGAASGIGAGSVAGILPVWFFDIPYWAASALLHLVILFLVGAYVISENNTAKKDPETIIVSRKYEPTPYDPGLKRDMEQTPKVLQEKEIKKEHIRRLKPEEITPDIPKGTSFDNLSDKDLNHKSFVDSFGAGGGAAGAYGNRAGKGCLVREGGGEGTEKAVLAALYWLKRHQSPDGRWSSHDFIKQCGKKVCRNKDKGFGDGRGIAGHDAGVTALAMLAFTGNGYTHLFGERHEFVVVVRKAMKYLKSIQVTDENDPEQGRFCRTNDNFWIYDQALATMALGELLVLSSDTLELSVAVRNAARFCLKAQNRGAGWRYGIQPGDSDTSISGWMVLALKTCKVAGLPDPAPVEYKRSFRDALSWFRKVSDPATGKTGYQKADEKRPHSTYCMTAVGVLCRILAGESRQSDFIKKGVDFIMRELPAWKNKKSRRGSRINFYYWYYGSYALFQNSGEPWKRWNKAMKKTLLKSQRVGGCEDGSWDPIGQWADRGGRVYSTALAAMTLEVYYRFVRATGNEF